MRLSAVFFCVSSQSTRVTDRQTDGQNYYRQDRASIAASRGNKTAHHRAAVMTSISTCLLSFVINASLCIVYFM